MWKKRISLWMMSLLMSFGMLTGCSPEMEEIGGELIGDIVNGVIDDVLSELESDQASIEDSIAETTEEFVEEITTIETEIETLLDIHGSYTSKEDVALYLYTYEMLPSNYITKSEARQLGWDSSAGNLWEVAEGMSIGGDRFWNNEKILPVEEDRQYYECDIDYEGGYRGAKRIIYSNDGLIYYTEDHYKSFEQLYPEVE